MNPRRVTGATGDAYPNGEEPAPVRGRTRVTPSALIKLAEAAAAAQLVVPVGTVSVRVTDEQGALGLRVTGPISSTPLSAGMPQETLLHRAERVRDGIGKDVSSLTGSRVGSVALHVTAVRLRGRRRVS